MTAARKILDAPARADLIAGVIRRLCDALPLLTCAIAAIAKLEGRSEREEALLTDVDDSLCRARNALDRAKRAAITIEKES